MNTEDFKKSWKEELDKFKPSVDDEQYQFSDVNFCDCVFSKEEIEKYSINNYGNFVDLTKQPSYLIPRGLIREERREYMKDVGRRDSYGLNKRRLSVFLRIQKKLINLGSLSQVKML